MKGIELEVIMPGKAKAYGAYSRDTNQEAAIMYNKEDKGKISKDALKRRLARIYSKKEG